MVYQSVLEYTNTKAISGVVVQEVLTSVVGGCFEIKSTVAMTTTLLLPVCSPSFVKLIWQAKLSISLSDFSLLHKVT